jgi:hypothetical protein
MSIIEDLDCEALISRLAGPLAPSARDAFVRVGIFGQEQSFSKFKNGPILLCVGNGANDPIG